MYYYKCARQLNFTNNCNQKMNANIIKRVAFLIIFNFSFESQFYYLFIFKINSSFKIIFKKFKLNLLCLKSSSI